ncbi:hypothetical protein [Kitasatospora sp. NPDC057198]|uniref:hypothetical protein n=1 Tax=Kitasatospora sp. NPDC057198 TaxID=3346046 RepID=UPI0036384DAA
MIVVTTLLGLLVVGLGVEYLRRGARSRRGEAPFAPGAGMLGTKAVRAGVERALLVLGVFFCFLGALIGLVGYFEAVGVMGGPPARARTRRRRPTALGRADRR